MAKNSKKKMNNKVKGVLSNCKSILHNAPNNGCIIKNINKKLTAINSGYSLM